MITEGVGVAGVPDAARRARWRVLLSGAMSPLARRTGWSMADQGLSSLTNFALSVFVARTVGPRQFGAFGLVFATYVLLLNVSRALGAEPLMIRFSAAEPDRQRSAIPGACGTAVVVGVVSAALVAAVATLSGGGTRTALLALAIMLPGLLLQDAWRFVFFTVSRPALAATNDAIWAVAQLAVFAMLYVHGVRTVAPLVLGWGFAAFLAAVGGGVQARTVPSVIAGVRWIGAHRDIGPLLALEFFTASGTGQLTLFSVAAVAGLASVASLRAADIVLGPMAVVTTGVLVIALPELTRVYARDPRRMRRLANVAGGLLAGAAVVVGLVAFFIPTSIGEAFLRQNWEPAHDVIVPYALALSFSGLATGFVLQMRIVEAMKETLVLRVMLLVAAVGGATIGAVYWQAKGAAWALAIVGAVFTWLTWVQARSVRGRIPRAQAG